MANKQIERLETWNDGLEHALSVEGGKVDALTGSPWKLMFTHLTHRQATNNALDDCSRRERKLVFHVWFALKKHGYVTKTPTSGYNFADTFKKAQFWTFVAQKRTEFLAAN